MIGSSADYLGTKERIETGFRFKDYLDMALAINPSEFSLLHARGRLAFEVCDLVVVGAGAVYRSHWLESQNRRRFVNKNDPGGFPHLDGKEAGNDVLLGAASSHLR